MSEVGKLSVGIVTSTDTDLVDKTLFPSLEDKWYSVERKEYLDVFASGGGGTIVPMVDASVSVSCIVIRNMDDAGAVTVTYNDPANPANIITIDPNGFVVLSRANVGVGESLAVIGAGELVRIIILYS